MHAPLRFADKDNVTRIFVPPHHAIEEHIVRMQSASHIFVSFLRHLPRQI
jgi:hypothetical protein